MATLFGRAKPARPHLLTCKHRNIASTEPCRCCLDGIAGYIVRRLATAVLLLYGIRFRSSSLHVVRVSSSCHEESHTSVDLPLPLSIVLPTRRQT